MTAEIILAMGVALLAAAQVLYRIFRDGDTAIIPEGPWVRGIRPWTPWLLAVMISIGAGLTVYSLTQLSGLERWFSAPPAPTVATPTDGQGAPSPGVMPLAQGAASTEAPDAGAAGNQDPQSRSSTSADAGEAAGVVEPENAAAPGDWLRDWSGLLALIFAALGIVMTLVTTIVISVSRSAVEDIRRMEKRMHSKKDEFFAEFKIEQEKCQEQFKDVADDIARTKVQGNFVLSMFRAHNANSQEIQAHRSNQQFYSRSSPIQTTGSSNSGDTVTIRHDLSKFYLLGSDNIYSQCEYAEFLSRESARVSGICLEEDLGYLKAVIDNLYCWLKHEKNQSADLILMKRVPEAILKLEEMKVRLSKSLRLSP